MASVSTLVYFVFLLFFSIAAGEKKKIDKIIIHVPYKIHKHHHTHTKYKVITVPSAKKENTVILLKEEIQPLTKQVPVVKSETKVNEFQPKTPLPFIPPHQQSASKLLDSIANHKKENLMPIDHYNTIVDDQKPLETHSEQNVKNLNPNFMYKPILLPSQENLIPNFSFKSPAIPPQNIFIPKLLNPIIHQSYEALLPKFTYQPIMHFPQDQFHSKFTYKPLSSPFPKVLLDNAHTSSQVYKTIVPPRPKVTSYKVREENEGDQITETLKHQSTALNTIPMSTMKPLKKAKSSIFPGSDLQLKNIGNAFQSNPDYEYEHVGYLIIDGNSRKVVGRNFKDEIHLFR